MIVHVIADGVKGESTQPQVQKHWHLSFGPRRITAWRCICIQCVLWFTHMWQCKHADSVKADTHMHFRPMCLCVCVLSGIQIWLLDGSNVSCFYFIRESGKVRVSTLAWEEPLLEADQHTHICKPLLPSVQRVWAQSGKELVFVHAGEHVWTYEHNII